MPKEKRSVRKQCLKCGMVSMVSPHQRRCVRLAFGVGSYACWGQLVNVKARKKPTPAARPRPQDAAAVKRDRAFRQILYWSRRVEADAKELARWRARAERFAALAKLTDEEVAARSAKAKAAAAAKAKPRRAMNLGKENGHEHHAAAV